MILKRQVFNSYIYMFGLALLAFFMPINEKIPKIILLFLLLNSLIEFNFKQKWMFIKENKRLFFITILFFIPVVFLFNTENINLGKYLIFNKLPFLLFPLIMFSSQKLSSKQLNFILLFAICGAFISSFLGFLAFKQIILIVSNYDVRRISPFIDRMTFSLIITINIFFIFYWIVNKTIKNKFLIVLAILIMIWFVFCLIKSEAFTGLLGLVLISFILLAKKIIIFKMPITLKLCIISAIPVIIIIFICENLYNYYTPTCKQNVSKYTKQGNIFINYSDKQRENGNFVFLDICYEELFENWKKYSNKKLFQIENGDTIFEQTRNGKLYEILLRYLTSKGLQKDAEGLSKLTSKDIKNIENGETNYKYANNSGLNRRMYIIVQEFDSYFHTGDPNAKSLVQRLEYNRIGLQLFKNNFWFGCGTGDLSDVFNQYYSSGKSLLLKQNQFLTHNQFLSFFISYGIFGGLICCFIWFFPLFSKKFSKSYFFIAFFIVATVAMFSNEMLETSTRIFFVSFYYVLFLVPQEKTVQSENQI